MEEKKLSFEKKLLSARAGNGSKWRIEDSVRSMRHPPPYRSELKSGPVSNPGTVPFEWEQVPGKPKDDRKILKSHVPECYEVSLPKLPPGRILRVGKQDFDKATNENVKQSGRSRDEENEVEDSSSGNDEDEFVDALETLSRADSLLINCSLSGLSGLEDSGMKVSMNSPIDSQTRDFMMGRFLPAAKAMASSETPQHVPRKPPVQLGKTGNDDKKPQLRYGPDFALEYSQQNGYGYEESDAEYDEGENFHGKVCGFLPGLGLLSSFCFLNPLPGTSTRGHAPMSPHRKSQTKKSSWDYSAADIEPYLVDTSEQMNLVGYETSKHQANRKALENNDIPIPYLSLDGLSEAMVVENRSKNSGIESQSAERTLYVDTEHKLRSLHVKSCGSDSDGQTELEVTNHHTITEKRDSDNVNTEKSNLMKKGAKSETKFEMPDFHIVMQKSSGKAQDAFKGSNMPGQEFDMMCPKGPRKFYSELPAPPPLPKSPADSWLGRTLHSISTKNTSVDHSYRGTWIAPKDQEPKPKSSDPKWETMVRLTKMQEKHSCFSEDRLTPIPEA